MYCSNCGERIDPNAAVCIYCGTSCSRPVPANAKSRIAAALFAFFLGTIGVHNFYLGYVGKGIAQVLITVLTCGYGAVVTFIWSLVEGIILLTDKSKTDARGNPLTD